MQIKGDRHMMTMIMLLVGFGPFDSKPYLTPTASPTSSICVNWNTVLPDSSIVAYGLTAGLEDTIRSEDTTHYHHVTLSGMIPGARYFYQVLPGGQLNSFYTCPLAADSFFFLTIGDTRTDSIAHQSVIDRMAQHQAEFFTHSGDLVEIGDNEYEWRTFFNTEDTLLQSMLFLPAVGNHESPYWQYDTLFLLPDSEDYYSVNYLNAHVVSLNTEIDLYGDQYAWLENDLAYASTNPAVDWIFVNLHRPPYSSGAHGSQLDVQAAWCPFFETYGVDIVFCGHDHDYERTYPINGVVYIVTGGGGAPLRGVGMNTWTAYSESTYQFCLVKIKGLSLFLKAIKPDGTVFDSLILDKPSGVDDDEPMRTKTSRLLSLSPNPFTRILNMKCVVPCDQAGMLMIFDCAGQCVEKIKIKSTGGRQSWTWRLSGSDQKTLRPGVYFVVLKHGERLAVRKAVKAN
jgi:hypothetical protein